MMSTRTRAAQRPKMSLGQQPAVRLVSVRSAFPRHEVDAAQTTAALVQLFPGEDPAFVAELVRSCGVERRHIALPLQDTLAERGFTERNASWRECALALAERAAKDALAAARLAATEVDVVIDVSCTGVCIPALDVELSQRLGLRTDVRRIPITESGCAAGALALSMAGSFARLGERTLVVAVELCSLTLCRGDASRTNLVASVLFGDGAAAAVLDPSGRGPVLLGSASRLLPDTSGLMGFDVGTHGLRIVLQRELPTVLAGELRSAIEGFLAASGRSVDDVALHLVHPGGRRILDAYAEIFELDEEELAISRESLRRYGNLSSVSVLTLLEIALEQGAHAGHAHSGDGRAGSKHAGRGGDALVVGVGPGLSLELSLWSFGA